MDGKLFGLTSWSVGCTSHMKVTGLMLSMGSRIRMPLCVVMLSLRRALTSYLTSGWSTSVDLDRYSKALCTCTVRAALILRPYDCCIFFV